jgi:hypothetical protein
VRGRDPRTGDLAVGPQVRILPKRLAPALVCEREREDAELAQADEYEVAAYIKAPLASGLEAWVYADARGKPPAA